MTFPDARSLLHRYLLGELTDEEIHEIEQREFAANADDCREWIRRAESELIAAYVFGCLTLNKRERFEKFFLRSEERREKLSLAELLREYAKAGATRRPHNDAFLRRYCLGEMSQDEQSKLEERLANSERLMRRLQTVRRELIAACVLKRLSDAEQESFQRHLFSSEEGVELFEFAEAVYAHYACIEWVTTQANARAKWGDRLRQWLTKPVVNET